MSNAYGRTHGPQGTRRDSQGRVARMLVSEWAPEQRARIRAILLSLLDPSDPQIFARPEMQLVALIDRAQP